MSSYDVTTFILYSIVRSFVSFRIRWFNIYIYIYIERERERKISPTYYTFLYVHLKVQDQFGRVSLRNFVLIDLLSYQHHNLKLIMTKMLQYVDTSKSRILHILHPVERPVQVNECCCLFVEEPQYYQLVCDD
jgi:hypothetical protein